MEKREKTISLEWNDSTEKEKPMMKENMTQKQKETLKSKVGIQISMGLPLQTI